MERVISGGNPVAPTICVESPSVSHCEKVKNGVNRPRFVWCAGRHVTEHRNPPSFIRPTTAELWRWAVWIFANWMSRRRNLRWQSVLSRNCCRLWVILGKAWSLCGPYYSREEGWGVLPVNRGPAEATALSQEGSGFIPGAARIHLASHMSCSFC